jgi:hypothetical protein
MTDEQRKEEICRAYVLAVAARCGYKVITWSQDTGCVDVSIGASGAIGEGTLADPLLHLQLKCTSDAKHALKHGSISWFLERAHYEKLRARAANPKLLVVLLLPERREEWVTHTVEELVLRRCAYWVKMTGMPETTNDSGVTIRLPAHQVFSPEQLRGLMERLSREEEI